MNYFELEKETLDGKNYFITIKLSTEKNRRGNCIEEYELIKQFMLSFPKYTLCLGAEAQLSVWYSKDVATIKTGKWRVPDLDELEKTISSNPEWEKCEFPAEPIPDVEDEEMEEMDNEEEDRELGIIYFNVGRMQETFGDNLTTIVELSSVPEGLDDEYEMYESARKKVHEVLPKYTLEELMENVFEVFYRSEVGIDKRGFPEKFPDNLTHPTVDEVRKDFESLPEIFQQGRWETYEEDED